MTDIVERLRKAYESTDEWAIVMEAADAIESLDAALEAAQQLAMSRGDELIEKDAEIKRNDAQVFRAIDRIKELESAVDCLTAERDALRADAERYRFIRTNPQWIGWDSDFASEEVDREIDAARKA